MRPVILALLTGLSSAAAQQPTDPLELLRDAPKARQFAEVVRRLGSEDVAEVAWGGWLASELGVREAAPELRRALRRLAELPPRDRERRFAAVALLDALIRGDAEPSHAELAPFLSGATFDAAFVLLARRPTDHREALMNLLSAHSHQTGRMVVFLACGNLLAATRAKHGFAKHLLDGLRAELVLRVFDADDFEMGGSGHSWSTGRGSGRVTVPEGFPPAVDFDLELRAERFTGLVAAGHEPVGYSRAVHRGRTFGVGGSSPRFEPREHFLMWLAELAGKPADELGFHLEETRWIDLRKEDYLIAATRERDRILSGFGALVAALHTAGFLDAGEASAAALQLEIRVEDSRKDRSRELPDLPPRRVSDPRDR